MPKKESINLQKKYEIIQFLKQKVKKYKLKSESNVYRILNNRQNMISTYEGGNQRTKRTKLKNGKFTQIESAFNQFMTNVRRDPDITIDGLLLKEKSLEYAEKAQIKGFNASEGQLANFKRRHGIKFGAIHVYLYLLEYSYDKKLRFSFEFCKRLKLNEFINNYSL